ncbi:hypothetical protein EV421DRAFT_1797302 [Armillaria borealis]|uniref:Uncharacterized protein n=1 Tax=Armillaria borealis TaxID=47425 RepID=A0AA39JN20_9AGAR|nr:hypothetical protein EV421DRAFT_1797302 [Armillaria borealis]
MPPKPAEAAFSPDVKNMDDWARRTRMSLTTADALGATYARAQPWFEHLKHRMLFTLENASIWSSTTGHPAGPPLKLQLPVHVSSFFSPDRRVQWQMVFHSDIFESVRKICPPIADILYLLQCLLPLELYITPLLFPRHLGLSGLLIWTVETLWGVLGAWGEQS